MSVALTMLMTVTLLAQPESARAEDAVERGIQLRLQGREEEALEVLRKAEATAPTPRGRAQLAFAEQSLGLWRVAEEHLHVALEASHDPWIVRNRAVLEDARKTIAQHLGTLELRGGDGAEVRIDGEVVGRVPLKKPVRLEAGRHRVEVSAPGFYPLARDVEIVGDGVARESIVLTPLPVVKSPSPDAGTRRPLAESSTPPAPHPWPSALGWTLAAVGIAGVGAGAASVFVSNGYAKDYNDDPRCGRSDEPGSCNDDASSSRTWRTVAVASFVAGGLLLAGGITMVLLRPKDAPLTVRAAPARTGAALFVDGSF